MPDAVAVPIIRELPVLVLSPHNRCNCRCVMCDIWRIRQVRELTPDDIAAHIESLRALKVRWVVLTGGEPLLHTAFSAVCSALRVLDARLTLLTAGLLLERRAAEIARYVDDVIVSVDGPPHVHDRIRGVARAFERLQAGIGRLRALRPDIPVHGRCTVQKSNVGQLRGTVRAARDALGLSSISFLAADLKSEAFNRPGAWPANRQAELAPDAADVDALEREIEALLTDCAREIDSGFILEPPEKLRRLLLHFRAHLGQAEARAPRCNAPWASAVIEADGAVRPCFFHPAIGSIHDGPLSSVLNSEAALRFRRELDVSRDPTCRNCVCSLFVARAKRA